MVKPERRTRADVAIAALLAVTVVVIAAVIWWTSDERATISQPAATPIQTPGTAKSVPATLSELWSAASPATNAPVIVGGTLATGDGRRVDGHDGATGQSRWSYTRDTDLCAVSWVYHSVLAIYRDDRGCGQVSALDAATGHRDGARSSYTDPAVTVSSNGTAALSAGHTKLEMWRSDLVRTLVYGETDARVKPSARGLHSGCTLESAAAGSSAASVLEACTGQADLRLVLLRPGKDDDEPQQRLVSEPGVRPGKGARVLAVSENNTAVYLPTPHPRVDVVDDTGTTVSSTLLAAAPSTNAPTPSCVSRAGNQVTWWTGDALLVFDAGSLMHRYTIAAGDAAPLGPAAMMAGRLLVPITGGIGVYEPQTGRNDTIIEVRRDGVAPGTPVVVGVSGVRVFEQRGARVVALG